MKQLGIVVFSLIVLSHSFGLRLIGDCLNCPAVESEVTHGSCNSEEMSCCVIEETCCTDQQIECSKENDVLITFQELTEWEKFEIEFQQVIPSLIFFSDVFKGVVFNLSDISEQHYSPPPDFNTIHLDFLQIWRI